jgi:predicted nucleotidyltransferase
VRRDEALAILRREKPRLMKQYRIESMILFGSVARDEAGPGSDVDVVVQMPPDLFAQIALAEDLERALGVEVDVVRDHDGLRPFFWKRLAWYGVYV